MDEFRRHVQRFTRMLTRGGTLLSMAHPTVFIVPQAGLPSGGGRPPKATETIRKLLEENVKERPAATVSARGSFLEHATGKALSDSTIRRLLKRMGFSQKTECCGGAWNETSS